MAYTTIDDPSAYFKVHLYTGTGSSNAQTFADTDTDMQPDLVWIKTRGVSESHVVFDSVRTNGYYLKADATSAQIDGSSGGSNLWTSFDSDGFTVDSTGARTNTNTYTYAAWCWKGGTTSGKSTSGESITPSGYSINATSGVGIFAWSGTGSNGTITHGLGGDVGKGMMIVKQLNSTAGWQVYHQGSGATHTWYFNSTAVPDDSDTVWNDTAPTSSVFTLGTNTGTNASGSTYVGYVFAPKQGFSKFGTYEGNGDADGTFVYTGFKPKMIICKSIDGTSGSYIIPSKTDWVNGDTYWAYVYSSTTESNAAFVDFHSNGFKLRKNDDINNAETYVYMAFAEAPFVNSNGVPCTAR
jgi:hypothetical protein